MSLPSSIKKTTTNAKVGLTCIGLGLVIIGSIFTWVLWRSYRRAVETREWDINPCIVGMSEIDEVRDSLSAAPVFELRLKYSYTLNLQGYDSYRVVRQDASVEPKITRSVKDRSAVDELVAKYPAGKNTYCYVNPQDPKQAVLEHGTKAGLYSIWFPLLFVVGGLGMILNVWLPHSEDKLVLSKTGKAPKPVEASQTEAEANAETPAAPVVAEDTPNT